MRSRSRPRATLHTVIPRVRMTGLKPGEERRQTEALRREWARGRAPNSSYVPARDYWLEETMRRATPQQAALYALSKLTGGWANFLEEPAQAAGIYANLFAHIGRRYVVGFYPTNRERGGKRRRVVVEVRGHPEYTVWGRKSYNAPGP